MAVGLRATSLFSDANLTAYYEFESGALTTDSKGTYTLTSNGSPTSVTGKFAGAVDLGNPNTTSFYTRSNDNWGIGTGNNWSVSIWVKFTAEIGSGIIGLWAFQQATRNTNIDLQYDFNGGTRRLNLRRSRVGVATDTVSKTVTLGTTWHNIVCTYDGTTLSIYVDNGAATTGTSSGDGSSAQTASLSIGEDLSGDSLVNGQIDDTSVFNRTISSSDVTTIFNSPTGNLGTAKTLTGVGA